jgi:putative aldouronate transport system permease protein
MSSILQRGEDRRGRRNSHREPLLKHIRKHPYLHLMILPALAWLVIFQYLPIYGITTAFQDFTMRKGYFGSPWVGLKHFLYLFRNPGFQQAFVNTWVINLGKLALGFASAVTLALMINEVRSSGFKRTIQTISYLPHFISWVILAGIFNPLFTYKTGAVSHLMASLGLPMVDFLQDNAWFRPFIVVTHVWKEVGWGSIIYLAAIAGINPELYEAAWVDGAGRWRQLTAITLPAIASTMLVVFTLNLGSVLNWSFDQIYNLYSPLVYKSGDIMQTYMMRSLISAPNFSRLAAAGLIQSSIGLLMLLGANALARRFGRSSIY